MSMVKKHKKLILIFDVSRLLVLAFKHQICRKSEEKLRKSFDIPQEANYHVPEMSLKGLKLSLLVNFLGFGFFGGDQLVL
jgi:hypothetical protein